jgi:hypothetical protein
LKEFAKEGNLILDTHVGSGSSRIACDKGGFNFTGFEIDKDYWEAQEKRFLIINDNCACSEWHGAQLINNQIERE